MSSYLIVTWDGAGNQVPTLGIAEALVGAGHDVTVLGHRSIDERCGRGGWTFRPFATAPEYDAIRPGDPAEEMPYLVENVFFSADIARDVLSEFDRRPADVVLVDSLMPTALSAAEALPARSVALFHTAYCILRGGPLLDMVSMALPLLGAVRTELGLDAVSGLPELHDRCDLALVASVREFEAPGEPAHNVRFVGPILDGPTLAPVDSVESIESVTSAGESADPLVLVSLSTSDMGQSALLQRIVEAMAQMPARILVTTGPAVDPSSLRRGTNTQVVGYVPHASVLPRAAAVVTHAGLGTVMAALSHGVPLLCAPMGRDQFFNAGRVADLGAGTVLAADADADAIAAAVRSTLSDSALREGAEQMGKVIGSHGGAAEAVEALAQLAGC